MMIWHGWGMSWIGDKYRWHVHGMNEVDCHGLELIWHESGIDIGIAQVEYGVL